MNRFSNAILVAAIAAAAGCVTTDGDDATTGTEVQAASSCSLPPPGVPALVGLTSAGRPISRSALPPAAQYDLDLTMRFAGATGSDDPWVCDFIDHGGGVTALICTNKVTDQTCKASAGPDGPEYNCDNPDKPTC